MGAAAKKGYIQNNPFKEIKIKKVKNTVDYLTEDELAAFFKIYSERTIAPKLYHTIEYFLFMCFTSLHISDARNMMATKIRCFFRLSAAAASFGW